MTPSVPNSADPGNVAIPSTILSCEPSAVSPQDHTAILSMSAEVFPNAKIDLGTSIDPEIENWEHFVVSVTISGDVSDRIARDREWHRRLCTEYRSVARQYVLDIHIA